MPDSDASKMPPTPGDSPRREEGAATRRMTSTELLGAASAVVIVHNGREYVLRVTQNGKLILTA